MITSQIGAIVITNGQQQRLKSKANCTVKEMQSQFSICNTLNEKSEQEHSVSAPIGKFI